VVRGTGAVRVARLKGREAIEARYGTTRSFTLRLLYTWLTLTMLFTFTWPLLVMLTDAPGVDPEDTPLDWFQLRFLSVAVTGAFAAWLWYLSPVPTDTANRSRALNLFRQGRIWPQALVFMLGLVLVLAALMLAENPAGALKLLSLSLAEALTIQIIISGYLAGAFDLLLEGRPGWPVVGLFALTFAMRGALAAAAQEVLPEGELILAISSGLVGGALIGGLSVWLRARSSSLLPGVLALWLLFLLLGIGGFYEG
jgi:hypothetical protein